MFVRNLYQATDAIRRLIEFNVKTLLARQGLPAQATVSAMPPERVGGAERTLNLHLYHALTDAHHNNAPASGGGPGAPNSRTALPFSLFYILTAHHEVDDVFNAAMQQQYFGLGVKTLHDFPLIDDTLSFDLNDGNGPQPAIPPEIHNEGVRIEVSPRPLTPEEALSFWSAEQSATTRLSAYYEARTVLLEPELPSSTPGRVFDMGLFIHAGPGPQLDRVSGLVNFTPPVQSGLPEQTIETAPARATLTNLAPIAVNRVVLEGSGLTGDGSIGGAQIMLRHPDWAFPAPIDPDLNPAWNVEMDERRAAFDFQGALMVDPGGGPVALDVVPGIYTASVRTRRRRSAASGAFRDSHVESRRIPFSLGPRIAAMPPPAGAVATIQLVNLFDASVPGLEVELAVDGELYDDAEGAPLAPGLFRRDPAAITFEMLAPPDPGPHSVRLTVNGAEAQPFWFTA